MRCEFKSTNHGCELEAESDGLCIFHLPKFPLKSSAAQAGLVSAAEINEGWSRFWLYVAVIVLTAQGALVLLAIRRRFRR
jgi:hypothetical protein